MSSTPAIHDDTPWRALPSPPPRWIVNIFLVALIYLVYSAVVGAYAARVYEEMDSVPSVLPLRLEGDVGVGGRMKRISSSKAAKIISEAAVSAQVDVTSVPTVAQLRKTISPITNLVHSRSDRGRWNMWILAEAKTSQDSMDELEGRYTFAYRSYVNFEEKNALAYSFYPIQRFFAISTRRVGTMTINSGRSNTNEFNVSISDFFWMKPFVPATITWRGVLQSTRGILGTSKQLRIIWTDTEMEVSGKRTIRPPMAETLRQIPWDIVKFDDGMLLLQRGDIGVLAYDRRNG